MIETLIELVLGFLFPSLGRNKRRREEWSGRVEEKRIRDGYSVAKNRYVVVFRTDDGRRRKIKLDRPDAFDGYETGRRYHKPEGWDYPVPAD